MIGLAAVACILVVGLPAAACIIMIGLSTTFCILPMIVIATTVCVLVGAYCCYKRIYIRLLKR